jgi:hypothetical protein
MNNPKVQNEVPQQEFDEPKRPYEKPAIVYRAPLEAVAGVCSASPGKTEALLCTSIYS